MVQLKDSYDDQYMYFHLPLVFPFKTTLNSKMLFYASFTLLKDDDGLFLEWVRSLAVF